MTMTDLSYIDDLFAAARHPAHAPRLARITCRVCERAAQVPADAAGLLCPPCRENLATTRAHVQHCLQATAQRCEALWTQLEADVAHADEATLARWHRFQDAVMSGDAAVRTTEDRVRARQVAGPFADLIARWIAYQDAHQALARATRWAQAAGDELDAAEEGA